MPRHAAACCVTPQQLLAALLLTLLTALSLLLLPGRRVEPIPQELLVPEGVEAGEGGAAAGSGSTSHQGGDVPSFLIPDDQLLKPVTRKKDDEEEMKVVRSAAPAATAATAALSPAGLGMAAAAGTDAAAEAAAGGSSVAQQGEAAEGGAAAAAAATAGDEEGATAATARAGSSAAPQPPKPAPPKKKKGVKMALNWQYKDDRDETVKRYTVDGDQVDVGASAEPAPEKKTARKKERAKDSHEGARPWGHTVAATSRGSRVNVYNEVQFPELTEAMTQEGRGRKEGEGEAAQDYTLIALKKLTTSELPFFVYEVICVRMCWCLRGRTRVDP